MKKIRLLLVLCYFTTTIQAQEQLDCDFNLREAIFYLQGDENFKRDTLKSINYIQPCIEKGVAEAEILLSRIYASQTEKGQHKKAFKILKKLAKKEHAIAAGDLGVLYKYGIGCRLNFNKARKWFEKGAALGNDKAAYSLGYLYLKGFGDIAQHYGKAVKWFEKSTHPMAKYWLGVSYYYGDGVDQNTDKANELLGTNFENVPQETHTNSSAETSSNGASNQSEFNDEKTDNALPVSNENLIGKWSGKLLKFDWSGKKIRQKNDFVLEIKHDSVTENLVYDVKINDQEYKEEIVSRIDNELYFDQIYINLPHHSFSEHIAKDLDYQFLSTQVSIKNMHGITFLTGNIKNYLNAWDESGAPLKFVLKKKEAFANSEQELSDEILTALSAQEDNFIKLYPNPFKTDLIISYTLDLPSFVAVKLTNIQGTNIELIKKGSEQQPGDHRYYFEGSNLEKGIYVVTVVVNNERKTRIIIKK